MYLMCTPPRTLVIYRTLAILTASTAIASSLCFAQPAIQLTTPVDGFQGIWYEAAAGGGEFANKYGGGLSTYPQQIAPMAIYSPEVDRTYFTFSVNVNLTPGTGHPLGHVVSYFDHETGLVAKPQLWLNKETPDAHDAPVLSLDDEGYLYLFSNTHGEHRRSYINRSAEPHSITQTISLLTTDPTDMEVFGSVPGSNPAPEPRFSYGAAWYVPNAVSEEKFLLLHTRYVYGSNRRLYTTTSSDGDLWTPRKALSAIEWGQYQTSWIKPDGATVGTIFNVHPIDLGLNYRTDLYYLETSDQANTWRSVDGVTIVDNSGPSSNPLYGRPDGPSDGAALVYDAAPGERVYLKDINYDADGNPVILFLTTPTHVPGNHPDRLVRTAHWTGSDWTINTITATDHNYDHGSLYVEEDGTWRVIAPFLDGPQEFGTGGEIGVWTSLDEGDNWNLHQRLTTESQFNHSYVQRPLNANDDFYAFWADGNAFTPSRVGLYFSDKSGQVFKLPSSITTSAGTDGTGANLVQMISPIPIGLPWSPLPGDFNADGAIDLSDLDMLAANAGSTNPLYDLDGDGVATFLVSASGVSSDSDYLVRTILGTEYGDTNLDGVIDGTDFSTLLGGFGTSSGWAAGNLNGDSVIDGTDFSTLLGNFGFSGGGSESSVPEPAAATLIGMMLIGVSLCCNGEARTRRNKHLQR